MNDLAEDSHHGKQETSVSLILVLEGTEQGENVGIYVDLGLARGPSISQPGLAWSLPLLLLSAFPPPAVHPAPQAENGISFGPAPGSGTDLAKQTGCSSCDCWLLMDGQSGWLC